MKRRTLLSSCSALVGVAVLAACSDASAPTPASIVTQAVNAVKSLDVALQQVVVQYPTLIPPKVYAAIENDVSLAETVATSLVAGMPAMTGATIVKQVEGYLNDVLTQLAAPPINGLIPAPFNQVVAAAAFVLPMLEAFTAQYVPATAAASLDGAKAGVLFRTSGAVSSVDQANAVLAVWAAKK